MTNKQFAAGNKEFRKACEAVRFEPARRQASKWRRGKGLAYKEGRDTDGT